MKNNTNYYMETHVCELFILKVCEGVLCCFILLACKSLPANRRLAEQKQKILGLLDHPMDQ